MAELVHGVAHILFVEDNPADVRFMRQALEESQSAARLAIVSDGVQALDYLHRSGSYRDAARPDLVVLDLHLPKKDGREVLAEVKADPQLRSIPVVVLSTSSSAEDVAEAYRLHANCYITKPFDLEDYIAVIHAITRFWIEVAQFPA